MFAQRRFKLAAPSVIVLIPMYHKMALNFSIQHFFALVLALRPFPFTSLRLSRHVHNEFTFLICVMNLSTAIIRMHNVPCFYA